MFLKKNVCFVVLSLICAIHVFVLADEKTDKPQTNENVKYLDLAKQPNRWHMLDVKGYGARGSVGIVYLPEEKTFLMVGGKMYKDNPYSEVTFNIKESRWENRFPFGKEGVWGDITGNSKAPIRGYNSPGFEVTEGVLRPHLDFGYNHSVELWGNAAYDTSRNKVVVIIHRLQQTYEYDPKLRTWALIETAKNATVEFWDDVVFGRAFYDPIQKEVVAGQGRWALRNGVWEKIVFGNEKDSEVIKKIEEVSYTQRALIGAYRARYYGTESQSMAEANNENKASEIKSQVQSIITLLKSMGSKAEGYQAKKINYTIEDLDKSILSIDKGIEASKGKNLKEAIKIFEEAWEFIDDAVEDMAIAPPKRAYCSYAVDEKKGKVLLFGGYRLDRFIADTWIYDCKTRIWEYRRPIISPSPRYGHGLVWLPKSGKIMLIDGSARASLAETWLYDIDTNEWKLLDEGDVKRDSITSGASIWGWQPEPSVASEDDMVITISNRNEVKNVPRFSTWGAYFEITKINEAGTNKLGVPFRKEEALNDPLWYDEKAGEFNFTENQAWLDKLEPNTWATIDIATQKNNPRTNRAWGTIIYDPDHDQFLQWGGGHVAYTGNNVLHYSIKANRFYVGHRSEDGIVYAGGQGGMKMSKTYRNRAFMTGHSYHSYGYDTTSGLLLVCGQTVAENTVKESYYMAYDPAKGEWLPTPVVTPFNPNYGMDRICTTPKGLYAWSAEKGNLWKYDPKNHKFEAMPLSGEKLGGVGHEAHGLVYDSKRDRLLAFSHNFKCQVYSYDLSSGKLSALNPIGKDTVVQMECRELVYLPFCDSVLIAAPKADAEGKLRWPLYNCEKNEWSTIQLGGKSVVGKSYSVSIGLMYDTKRNLVWAANETPHISALKIDMSTADIQPLK